MLGIADYFWRLIPANPILLRVVQMGSKRRRDLFIRCSYLAFLIGVVIFSLLGSNDSVGNASLAELAKTSANLFQRMSYCQLALVALLAPIFTAGAITQEKDSQTYDILLATPLTNGQIVLGSLLSRLFFVIALLVSGIPIFSITQIFGGVAISSIVRSFGIAAATAFVTGALAMAIAVFKVGTRRTIFSFYLFIVLYLMGLFLLDQLDVFKVVLGTDPSTGQPILSKTSWLTGMHPFLALRVIFNDKDYLPPAFGDLPERLRGWPIGWYLSDPAGFYTTFMFFLSFLLVMPSIVVLRRLAQSTTTLRTLVMQRLGLSRGERTRKPRYVWNNPIAWREAKTKASAARASILRYGFIGAGMIGAFVLVWMFASVAPAPAHRNYIDTVSFNGLYNQLTVYSLDDTAPVTLLVTGATSYSLDGKPVNSVDDLRGRLEVVATPVYDASHNAKSWASIQAFTAQRRIKADDARQYLLGATMVEFAVILLIVTNAAASTVTREKEDGTLDLLLSTPITSRYYIWGKLRGLVSFVLPLVAVPVLSVLLFVLYDLIRLIGNRDDPNFKWIVFPEAVLIMPGMLIIVSAFAAILGMQMSLRCRKTVVAVMSSVGIIVGICGLLGFCGYQLLQNSTADFIGAVGGSFSPFTLLMMLINPYAFSGRTFAGEDLAGVRWTMIIFSFIAIGAYTALVWSMYSSMVKNFDMTIRRQQR